MTNCDYLLSKDIKQNCTEPLLKGVEVRGALINKVDIAIGAIVFDATDPTHIIKTLPLSAGKRAYDVIQPAKNPFAGTKSDMEEGTYLNTMSHESQIVILDSGPDVANQIDALMNGEFVLILENKAKNMQSAKPGVSAFQIFGYHQGMRASAIASEKWSDDTRSGWLVTLKETQAPVSALYLYDTSYATTKAAFESLVVVG